MNRFIDDDCDESFDRMRDDKLTDAADKNYDFSQLTRKINLVRFFDAVDSLNSESDTDAAELAEREQELKVTPEEWAEHRKEREIQF